MKRLPVSGRVSMLTTGIFFEARSASSGAIAAVSCGAITMAFAPWLTSAWALAISFCTSFCELVVLMLAPNWEANFGT